MCTSKISQSSKMPLSYASLHNSIILKLCFSFASLLSGSSVALQAAVAHLPDKDFITTHGRNMVETASNLALWHGIALCVLTIGAPYLHPTRIRLACLFMLTGTVLFTASITLYGFHITLNAHYAPWGGTLLIVSWLITASTVFKCHPRR